MDPDNGTAMLVEQFDGCTTGELLAEISERVGARRRLEVDEVCGIIAWADRNTVDAPEGAATLSEGYLDTGVPIAGPGAPKVSEFGLMELIATLDRTPDGGRDHVGKVIELGWRLPRIFQQVVAGRCPVFKALRVAEHTRSLTIDAATFVDRHLHGVVGRCTWAQVDRLIAEAIIRYDPAAAEEERKKASDRRRFDLHLDQAEHGVVPVDGLLDAGDAADLDSAIARRATTLAACGSEDTLDVRRAVAAGELARHDLTLDLEVTDPDTGEITTTVAGRKAELHLHLNAAAITDTADGGMSPDTVVGRWGDRRCPVTADQIRAWCSLPGTQITVRPVIDLAGHVPVESYEIPDRLRRQVRLRDGSCRFPHCQRRAEACDLDHTEPYDKGGVTCPCNLVALCRQHHRAKTHAAWWYTPIDPATYLWSSAHGQTWLVDHHGTRHLDPPQRLDLTDPLATDEQTDPPPV